jgi:hypothetical protein
VAPGLASLVVSTSSWRRGNYGIFPAVLHAISVFLPITDHWGMTDSYGLPLYCKVKGRRNKDRDESETKSILKEFPVYEGDQMLIIIIKVGELVN